MKPYRLYIFDLDGVIYRGGEPISGASSALERIRSGGAAVRFLTNNSAQTRAAFADKLRGLGFAAEPEEVFSSAYGAARHVAPGSAFVVGEPGLKAELEGAGARVVEEGGADWVAVGICRGLTYDLIDEAQWRIRRGARFLATNIDSTYPDEGGRLRPGAGSVVAAVAEAAGRRPEITIGKPEPALALMILEDSGISLNETLLVGDRPDTDIECARRVGCDSALVLTGVTSRADAARAVPKPTYVLDSVAGLAAE
ncbi:MAG: HAD-IIA family hydrolase [Armatimonadetes bacterium]|nr:HAD-IIA family hydrolase [Armatimonadota bacterium]